MEKIRNGDVFRYTWVSFFSYSYFLLELSWKETISLEWPWNITSVCVYQRSFLRYSWHERKCISVYLFSYFWFKTTAMEFAHVDIEMHKQIGWEHLIRVMGVGNVWNTTIFKVHEVWCYLPYTIYTIQVPLISVIIRSFLYAIHPHTLNHFKARVI